MCGRYALKLVAGVLELPFVEESEFPKLELPWASYNVCPGTEAPIVDREGVLRPALWGLIPHWSKEPPKRPLFNARLETAPSRGSFRTAWASQRCVVPTSGFFEWSEKNGAKAPYFVPPDKDGSLLWLAGLASRWSPPEGEPRWTYTVLTESSEGTAIEEYHQRTPVTLRADQIEAWLHGEAQPGERGITGEPYRVSPKMNAASHNEPDNIEPLAEKA